jgi:prolyl oligopeptidase
MWSLALALLLAAAPPAERGDQIDDYHGVKVADPYRWLEDLDSPQTQAWVNAQRAYTGAWFAAAPQRAPMLARMRRLWNHDRMPLYGSKAGILVRGGRIFFLQQNGLANQPVLYVRDTPDAAPRVLLDINALAADGTASLAAWAPSPDGRWLAYGVARAGSDWQSWRVRDVSSGRDLADQLDWIKFSEPSWSADSRGFYYARYPQPEGNALTGRNEFQKLYYHRLETAQAADPLVYERPDHKDWQFTPHATEDGRYLVITVEQGTLTHTLLFYQDLKAAGGKTHELIPEFYAAQSFLGNRGGIFYVQTTYNGAPRPRRGHRSGTPRPRRLGGGGAAGERTPSAKHPGRLLAGAAIPEGRDWSGARPAARRPPRLRRAAAGELHRRHRRKLKALLFGGVVHLAADHLRLRPRG